MSTVLLRVVSFDLAIVVAVLSAVVLAVDACPRLVAAWKRRRASKGGAFGVVLDRRGIVLGTYLDPFGHPWRAPRVHEAGSPWVEPGIDGQGWAWEGFGATEEEAFAAANRLRRRHLQLLPWFGDDQGGDGDGQEDFLSLPRPYAPPTS
ncbi:MAG TPA: hypothetical protein VFR81_23140 [Longimicrobium sp.]|nr:hypothetical protein [Longimicrobium sp.]